MKLSYRIYVTQFREEASFRKLLAFLDTYRDCVDELALFTEYWHHGYYPLDDYRLLCGIMRDRIGQLKDGGFARVGINMLDTIGHLNEAWDVLPQLPYQAMTGHDGSLALSTFCPNSEPFRRYIADKYTMTALARPDFIWVDDDIRMQFHNIAFGCFCPVCIGMFNDKQATAFTRESLVERLNASDGGACREAWVRHNGETIERLLALIGTIVRGIDPAIELGLMTVAYSWTTYSGPDYDKWFAALQAVRARPGDGFYHDEKPFQLVQKAIEGSRQVALLPPFVTDIQYELENFPFQKLGKSRQIVLLECTASIMNGMNGIAFDALKDLEGDWDDYHDLMESIRSVKPFWSALRQRLNGFGGGGFVPAVSRQYDARRSVEGGNWFAYGAEDDANRSITLAGLGIPLTGESRSACGTILSGSMPYGYTSEELKEMLAGGVLLDGEALQAVWQKGLGDYCGVRIEAAYSNGVMERLTDDELNGRYNGEKRDGRALFAAETAYSLAPAGKGVRVLSELVTMTGEVCGPSFTLYENALGGRVAVHSYAPWKHIHSSLKKSQLTAALDWVSRGTMPVRIDACVKVVPFIRRSPDGKKFVLMLLNASFDATGAVEVEIRGVAPDTVVELQRDGTTTPVEAARISGEAGNVRVTIHDLAPWQFRVLCSGES
ncbi:MAG: hypothetical protein J7639_21975 [Paenibacillaceae bacterium]|nr:hypothetical protein [Paenibacillaceae bacterium]